MNPPTTTTPRPAPRIAMDVPVATHDAADDGIFGKWRAGWILFLRYLWLSFCLALLMAPANYLADRISLEKGPLFVAEGFRPAALLGMAVVLLWLPFAIWLATKMSGQTIVSSRRK